MSNYLKELALPGVYLAAQDVSSFPKGSYTGAVSADMLKDYVDYVVVGHSERRKYFKENNRMVANKVEEAVDAGIIPIVCVDEDSCSSQLSALNDIESKRVIVGYTPVEALNFRIPESPDRVARMAQAITNNKAEWPVIYGGSVRADNCKDYLALDTIAGIFVGSESLDPENFAAICNCVA